MTDTLVLTNAVLKGLMTDALVERGVCTNLDAMLPPGVYITISETTGTLPPTIGILAKYATLIVLPRRNTTSFQIIITESAQMAVRTYHGGSWNPWKELIT